MVHFYENHEANEKTNTHADCNHSVCRHFQLYGH